MSSSRRSLAPEGHYASDPLSPVEWSANQKLSGFDGGMSPVGL